MSDNDTSQKFLINKDDAKALAECYQDSTLSIIIMDRSGSMAEYRATVQNAVNKHLEAIKISPDGREQYCMVISFADTYKIEVPLTHANQIQNMENYRPDGLTLLFKTVYKTIKLFLGPYLNSSTARQKLKVVIGVFTDGEDNQSSTIFYPGKLQRIAQKAQKAGWELLTFGFGFDAKAVAKKMGFPTDNKHTFTVEKTEKGIESSSQTFTEATCSTGFFGKDYDPKK